MQRQSKKKTETHEPKSLPAEMFLRFIKAVGVRLCRVYGDVHIGQPRSEESEPLGLELESVRSLLVSVWGT